jgi:cytochrome c peroxidase
MLIRLFKSVALLAVWAMAPMASQGATTLNAEQRLGQALYMDVNLSLHRNQSCNSCHAMQPVVAEKTAGLVPVAAFVDPENVRDGSLVSKGSVAGAAGKLNAPSAAYAAFSPHFHWDAEEELYVGGQFWNGRAATLSEQAKGPPLNPLEMAMPSQWAVVNRLKENPYYVEQFRELYGLDLNAIAENDGTASDRLPPPGVGEAFERMAGAIAAFEKSRMFSPFSSKFDFVLAGQTTFTELERTGLELFNSEKSQCSACHPSKPLATPDGRFMPPLFTDFTFDNLGLPRNVNIPGNPEPDPGLGGRMDIAERDPQGSQLGKHKVVGLRNIAITPPYMHNGVLASLAQVVHFYNTRDTKPRECGDVNDPGFGQACWPAPEIATNVNSEELGDLRLTADEEAALVAFMETLTDGYAEWGNDPNVPPGTPSPFAELVLPPMP